MLLRKAFLVSDDTIMRLPKHRDKKKTEPALPSISKVGEWIDRSWVSLHWLYYMYYMSKTEKLNTHILLYTSIPNSWRRVDFSQKHPSLWLHLVIKPKSEEQRLVKYPVSKINSNKRQIEKWNSVLVLSRVFLNVLSLAGQRIWYNCPTHTLRNMINDHHGSHKMGSVHSLKS